MVKVTFIEPGGTRRDVDVAPGGSLMEAAVLNGVNGIIAECGGNCACGTCRVFVDPGQPQLPPAPIEPEASMLEFLDDNAQTLRLSCQVEITPALDGLVVEVSAEQR
ncbi:2Fe-2S iron-sulfur cluster-binding protein [Haliea sp. E17]|uniref:2Fe-2S iron-sulfur cluster-binding protein n=1 Tax=Haliea sp. E17 TaxID=3401576 RepID=UPI003AAC1FFD